MSHRASIHKRRAFTLLELLIVLVVVALLLSLLLPAIQASRSSARQLQCSNNLRRVSEASQQYQGNHGKYAVGWCALARSGIIVKPACFSAMAKLLPYLGYSAIADEIDWEDMVFDRPGAPAIGGTNAKLLALNIPALRCPADRAAAGSNYRQLAGLPSEVQIGAPAWRWVKSPQEYVDGMAHTAAFSERLIGIPGESNVQRDISVYSHPAANPLAIRCVSDEPIESTDSYGGTCWLRGSPRHNSYSHFLPPNSVLPDCQLNHGLEAVVTARSEHQGGVHVAFADSHVRFVTNSISYEVWLALGSPNGGETNHGQTD